MPLSLLAAGAAAVDCSSQCHHTVLVQAPGSMVHIRGTTGSCFLLQGLPSREMLDGMASAKDVHTALRDALKVSVPLAAECPQQGRV